MNKTRLFAASIAIAVVSVVTAVAQAPQGKIALVNTNAFYAKEGIKKIETGYKNLNVEFAAVEKELNDLNTRMQNLQKELQTLQQQAADPNSKVPIDRTHVQNKVDEFENLQVSMKRKQEDAKSEYAKREAAVIGPIVQDVSKALSDFAKQKGYSLVLDVGKMYDAQIVLYWEPATEITKEFITFYNSRQPGPAGSARSN